MSESGITLRIADMQDSQRLLQIYAPYVEKTAVTFEYAVPTVAQFSERIRRILEKYPYIIAELDGEAVGYAYADCFKARAAYDRAVETSIYVREDCRGGGIGKALYNSLEKALRSQNILNLYACIAYPDCEDEYLTRSSVEFHRHMGYRLIGKFYNCGYKFNRWYSMVWMEKHIGSHTENPPPIIPFNEIKKNFFE